MEYMNYVNGAFLASSGTQMIEVQNPSTGEFFAAVPDSTTDDVDRAVQAAKSAQPAWEKLPPQARAVYLRKIAAAIRDNVASIARTITQEQGKPLSLAQTEVCFAADYMDYMAEWARRIEGEIITSDRPNETIMLFRKPIGVTAGILPWNFPFFLIARKLAPALVTGNTIVIKSSEETPLNACMFASLLEQADVPPGVINILSGRGAGAGDALTRHGDVGLISFTGSVETGSRIMQTAAKNLTRVNLELGGKAPAIVLADADVKLAAKAVYDSRMLNSGQLCNCAERIYVDRKVADEFTDEIVNHMRATTFGDPLGNGDVMIGPLINQSARDKVARLVDGARRDGAEALVGGNIADMKGWHFEPTVLANCSGSMDIMQQEIFGPVIPIQQIDGVDEGISLANDSEYGLTSSIYTSNLASAHQAMRELRFGETYINRENFEAIQGFHAGRRKSGIGGADGKHGLYEYTETHVVYLQS